MSGEELQAFMLGIKTQGNVEAATVSTMSEQISKDISSVKMEDRLPADEVK